jgi:hypothetical protein
VKGVRVKGWGSCYQTRDQVGWGFATMRKILAFQVSWGSFLFPQGVQLTIVCTVSAKKLAHVQNFVTELCKFLGGGWEVIIAVKQHSQTLLAVRNKGGELILSKKTPQLKGKGPKKGKKAIFLKIRKSLIVDQPVQLES